MKCGKCGKELTTGDAPNSALCRQCEDTSTTQSSMSFGTGCAGCVSEHSPYSSCGSCTRNPAHKDKWTPKTEIGFHTTFIRLSKDTSE